MAQEDYKIVENGKENASYRQSTGGQTVIVQQTIKKSNGIGTAGFVLALIAFFFSWVPIVGWILWLLGLIFSLVGIFRTPRGLAIAGLIISIIDLIVLTLLVGIIMAAVAL